MVADAEAVVIMGRIVGVYGVKGWVKVMSFTAPMANLLDYPHWLLDERGCWKRTELEAGRRHGKGLVAKLKGWDDRDRVRQLVGRDIAVARQQLPEPAADEVYWTDLVGLAVVNRAGEPLGRVARLFETGANDVMVVTAAAREDLLIPFVAERYVEAVDLDKGIIRVDWEADY